VGTNPKLSMMSGECFQNGALEDGVTTIQTPNKMLAGHRTRVYNINPRFLEQRQESAVRRFEVQQESLRSLAEYVAEQAEE